MPTTTAAQNSGVVETAITFIQDGGFFMYPILVVLALGLALSLERIIYLQATKAKNQKTWKDVYPLIAKGQFRQALDVVSNSNTGMAKVIGYGLERAKTAKRHDDIELAMEEGLMEIIPRLEARTPYIGTFANIATLLGLLGTILGLISAFTAVASADPAQKADLLSASISVAMLLAFAFINAMAGKLVDSMEMASVKFVNVFRQVSAQQERKNDGQ
jgi:biopolymer transport protein ExbB/TolQ